jgi:hypothetical protein
VGSLKSAALNAPSRETLVGSVERVTFHKEENGFAVLKVKARGRRDLVAVVGHAASISAGERNVSTTLRQPAFEFRLGFVAFELAG